MLRQLRDLRRLGEALGKRNRLRQRGALGGRGRTGSIVQSGQPPQRVQPMLGRLKGFTDEMRELVLDAWRMVVPKRVAREVLGPEGD